MKTLKNLFFIFLLFNLSMAFGQNRKDKESVDLQLKFDYENKSWSYELKNETKAAETTEVSANNQTTVSSKGKPYFLVRYKSQPVIKVSNLPPNTKVTIEEYFYAITPEVENMDAIDKSMAVASTKKAEFIQTMATVDSDEVSYKVIIKNSTDDILHTTTVFAKVYGRLKIDLSTGIIFHTLQDESYYFSDAGNEQSSIAKDSNKGEIKPFFPAVLTHFYWQGKGFTNFGASVGLGLDDSGKVGYYLGPAIIMGDRQRVILSGGWAHRPTDILKGKYKEGQLLNSSNLPETSDLVESEYKSGFFFSFTYNLTSKVEKR